mgnify:CR=1 FL=1
MDAKEYQITEKEAYELMFYVVWGLQSLERESKEEYNVYDYLGKWLLKPLNLKVSNAYRRKRWDLSTVFTKIF